MLHGDAKKYMVCVLKKLCNVHLGSLIWTSRISISTKLKLYNTCILPISTLISECWAVDILQIDALDQRWLRKLLEMIWYHHEWNDEVRWATRQPHLLAFLPVRPHCTIARQNRCQKILTASPCREMEEITRTTSYHVDEDYLTRCDWESSTLQTEWNGTTMCGTFGAMHSSGASQKWKSLFRAGYEWTRHT